MIHLVAKWLVAALSFIIIAELLVGISIASTYIALIVAVLWGILSIFIKPLLIFITLPINILTFGLFTFVINALLLLFLASFVEGFVVEGFWWGVWGAIGISILNWIGNEFVRALDSQKKDVR